MPIGHSILKWKPRWTTDAAWCMYFTGGLVAINPNCRVCAVFPRTVVLSGWVGMFPFHTNHLFSTVFGQDLYAGWWGFSAGRCSFWATPSCPCGVGWEAQDQKPVWMMVISKGQWYIPASPNTAPEPSAWGVVATFPGLWKLMEL